MLTWAKLAAVLVSLVNTVLGLFEKFQWKKAGETSRALKQSEAENEKLRKAGKARRKARKRIADTPDDKLRDSHFRD